MARKKRVSTEHPRLNPQSVNQDPLRSPLVQRILQMVMLNRRFLDNFPDFKVDVHAVPGIDKLAAHLTSQPTELQEFHEFWLDWVQDLVSKVDSSEELLKKAQEEAIKQKKAAETDKAKSDREITKLRDRLRNYYDKFQAQIGQTQSFESENVQLKVQLDEAEKASEAWKINAKDEIANLARFFRRLDDVLNPRSCLADGSAASEVMVETQGLLKLAQEEMRSLNATIMEDSEALESDPIQHEVRNIVKYELGLVNFENLDIVSLNESNEPQGQVVVRPHKAVGYPAFGDADLADRIRLRNLLDVIQAYFAFKCNLHVRAGEPPLEHFTVLNLSLRWRKELGGIRDIPSARVQSGRQLLAGIDLDINVKKIVDNSAAMEMVCCQFSKYRTRGNEIHEPFDPALYERSIRRYCFYNPEDENKHEEILLEMLSVPPMLQSQLSTLASSTLSARTTRRN